MQPAESNLGDECPKCASDGTLVPLARTDRQSYMSTPTQDKMTISRSPHPSSDTPCPPLVFTSQHQHGELPHAPSPCPPPSVTQSRRGLTAIAHHHPPLIPPPHRLQFGLCSFSSGTAHHPSTHRDLRHQCRVPAEGPAPPQITAAPRSLLHPRRPRPRLSDQHTSGRPKVQSPRSRIVHVHAERRQWR